MELLNIANLAAYSAPRGNYIKIKPNVLLIDKMLFKTKTKYSALRKNFLENQTKYAALRENPIEKPNQIFRSERKLH
jgi:hypothetical protein